MNYQQEAARTFPIKGYELDLLHCVIGLNTEINEIEDALKFKDYVNLAEELGDAYWYIANFYNVTKNHFNIVSSAVVITNSSKDIVRELYRNISLFQDDVKKHVYYGRELKTEKLETIKALLFKLAELKNIDVERSLHNNIEKLKIRFPNKFTEDLANNRNLSEERTALEK